MEELKKLVKEIDPLEGYVGYFPSGCSFFNESVEIEPETAVIRLKERIIELLKAE